MGCVTLFFDKALIHLNFNSSECDEKVKHPCNKVTGTGDFTSLKRNPLYIRQVHNMN